MCRRYLYRARKAAQPRSTFTSSNSAQPRLLPRLAIFSPKRATPLLRGDRLLLEAAETYLWVRSIPRTQINTLDGRDKNHLSVLCRSVGLSTVAVTRRPGHRVLVALQRRRRQRVERHERDQQHLHQRHLRKQHVHAHQHGHGHKHQRRHGHNQQQHWREEAKKTIRHWYVKNDMKHYLGGACSCWA